MKYYLPTTEDLVKTTEELWVEYVGGRHELITLILGRQLCKLHQDLDERGAKP